MSKRQRVYRIATVCAVLLLCLLPMAPLLTDASQPPGLRDKAPPGLEDRQPFGWSRDNPYTTTQLVDIERKGQAVYATYTTIIDSLPSTLTDGVTLIDPVWYECIDDGGQKWYESGANLFTARVLQGRVSVESVDGHLAVWNPKLKLGRQVFQGGTAQVVADLWNDNYEANTLVWEYGEYSTGVWPFKHYAQVTRYLRLIEGHISEQWVLPMDPRADLTIELNHLEELYFEGDATWLYAYDANGTPLQAERSTSGAYTIKASEFRDKAYPVTIDPTMDFLSIQGNDGCLVATGTSYLSTHQMTNADYVGHFIIGYFVGGVGQHLASGTYELHRFATVWDTSGLPDNAVISEASIGIYIPSIFDTMGFDIVVQGHISKPSVPIVTGDYYEAWYEGDYGSIASGAVQTDTYNSILLNSEGRNAVSATGYSRFILRSSRDIAITAPTGSYQEWAQVYQREIGSGYAPKLSVTYTVPIVAPTVTTLSPTSITPTGAILHGTLTDDGNEACSTRFRYGPTTSVAYFTAWEADYSTGDPINKAIAGLSPGTVYYCRAEAQNSAGSSLGSLQSFYTLPYAPTYFTATPGDTEISLTWTKGTGADKTMIRRSTTENPTSPTSGTQVYFGTGSNYDNTSLTNGITYYYSAWSEVSGTYSDSYAEAEATPSEPLPPSITTNDATAVGTTTATLNSYLSSLHGAGSADVYFQWHKDGGVEWANETTPITYYGPSSHPADLTSLDTTSLYHFRAKAVSAQGTSYGAAKTFTTGDVCAPTMTTQGATGILQTAATLQGEVTADGGAYVTAWFEWGLTADNLSEVSPTKPGLLDTDPPFVYGLTNLSSDTTHYFRACGQNVDGGITRTGYGAVLNFTTNEAPAPTVLTNPAELIGAAQATLHGTILTDGGVPCEVRFQWGTNVSYGTDTAWLGGYTAGQSFSQIITGLEVDETYHFRAQARNEGGTASGSDATFITIFTAPTDLRAKAISHTTINLEWTKTGDQTLIRYKQSGYPIDRADGDLAYFGPSSTASVSGLTAAISYYFRAWSWREGNIWADGYDDDTATTLGIIDPAEEDRPDVVGPPTEPSGWFQVPSGAALRKLPLYDNFVGFANAYQLPEGTMWVNVTLLLTLAIGAIVYVKAKSSLVAVFVAGFTIVACSLLGMAPLWFLLIYAFLGGGLIYVTHRM